MDTFLDNAREIMTVAGATNETGDFAILVGANGGLHFIMEAPFALEAAATGTGARTAYRVRRSREGVRVEGWTSNGRSCVFGEERKRPSALRDQPLYRISSGDSTETDDTV